MHDELRRTFGSNSGISRKIEAKGEFGYGSCIAIITLMGLKATRVPSCGCQLHGALPIWGGLHFNLGYIELQVTPSREEGRPRGSEIINAESSDLEIAPWR